MDYMRFLSVLGGNILCSGPLLTLASLLKTGCLITGISRLLRALCHVCTQSVLRMEPSCTWRQGSVDLQGPRSCRL